jgi:putative aldouronate transport system substrate-binding protein
MILLAGSIGGCQQKDTTKPAESSSTATTKATQASGTTSADPNAEPIRFTLFYPWSDVIKSSDEITDPNSKYYDKRWGMILDQFNISIDYILADFGTMGEKIRVSASAGDLSDVSLSMGITARELQKLSSEGGIKLLPADVKEKYVNIKRNLDSITAADSYVNADGRFIALPRSLDVNGGNADYMFMLIYRKDIAQQAGIEIKDEYTVEEIFNMFGVIKEKFPEYTVFSHIWPTQILQLGVWQYSPQVVPGNTANFFFNEKTGKYDYAPALPETIEGIKWFKKFYDAGYVPQDFLNLQMYDARAQFSAGKLFCYMDGADIAFLDALRNMFKASNPALDASACLDTFVLLSSENKYMIQDWGGFAAEYIFSPQLDDAKFDRILSLFDYLMSDEGLYLCNYGIEGEHYVMSGDNLISIREKDPATGAYKSFGGADQLPCILQAIVPQAGIAEINPFIDEATRNRIRNLFQKRSADPNNLYIRKFDNKLNLYSSDALLQFTLDPISEINKLVIQESADSIEAVWNAWLADNQSIYRPIIDELNANLLK